MVGMDPERVEAARAALASELAALDSVHAAIGRVRLASLNPLNYAIEPGSLILAPAAIATTTIAMAMVTTAKSSAETLVGELVAQIGQQQDASAADAQSGSSASKTSPKNLSIPQLLAETAGMSASELTAFLANNPGYAAALAKASSDPTAVAAWWKSMNTDPTSKTIVEKPSAAQLVLINAMPGVIGSVDGVPYWARDQANNIVLNRELADPSTDPATRKTLEAVKLALGQGRNGSPPRELVSLELGTNPKAAIAVGDLDKAVNVSYIVPGMGTTVSGDMGKLTTAAYDLRNEQAQVSGVDSSKIAVVAWLNYTPPNSSDVAGVMSNQLAETGSDRLAANLNGLDAVHAAEGNPAVVSVVAHSYGTDVATLALTKAHADHLVLLGSAGVSHTITNAADLNVPNGQVFASQGKDDQWAPIGQQISGRQDPTAAAFGAHDFSSEASTGPQGQTLHAITEHGPDVNSGNNDKYSYLDKNTTAQYDTAKATMGHGTQIPRGDTPADRGFTLNQAKGDAAGQLLNPHGFEY
jgi:hypothetical protein